MKRLTINDIAKASLRTGKRAYRSLAIGIFLSIFLVTSVLLSVQGINLAEREKAYQRVGYEDVFMLDETVSLSELHETGLFSEIGQVYLTACAAGTPKYIGFCDETGGRLLNHRLAEGRMPEQSGEIALEQSMLDYLELDAQVGDMIELTLTPVDGVSETRTFAMTGILKEQTSWLDISDSFHSGRTIYFPAAFVHPEEEPFQSGRTAVHYLMKLQEGISQKEAMERCLEEQGIFLFSVTPGGTVEFDADMLDRYDWAVSSEYVIYLILIGAALMVACCVGISQSMESVLSRRVAQIGMLRAVGATRRQIRRIFGREAWMLALLLSPPAIAASCMVVFLLTRIAPEQMIFSASPMLILGILLISGACILLAAMLPLRRASRILPMGVIRDTEMMRKSQKIRSSMHFSVPRLISGRQGRLHRSRQVGSTVLVMLMLVCTALTVGFGLYDVSGYEEEPGFELENKGGMILNPFIDVMEETLSGQSMAQLRALPSVGRVDTFHTIFVNLLIGPDEEIPEYLRSDLVTVSSYHLSDSDDPFTNAAKATHERAREAMDVQGTLITVQMKVIPEIDREALLPYIQSGEVNPEAIDQGKEVLVYAPGIYQTASYISFSKPAEDVIRHTPNDAFAAGEALDVYQMYRTVASYSMDSTADGDQYASASIASAQPEVGAVLDGNVHKALEEVRDPCIVTTLKGARAMGLFVGRTDHVEIYMDGAVREEDEAYLVRQIEKIAMRFDVSDVRNNLEAARESDTARRQVTLILSGIAVVFFAVSFSLIAGNIRRRIHADERMIGTLRAVGANRKAITGCYSGQVSGSIALGLGMAAAVCVLLLASDVPVTAVNAILATAVMTLCAAGCLVCCRGAMNLSIGEVMKKSVVENIREL